MRGLKLWIKIYRSFFVRGARSRHFAFRECVLMRNEATVSCDWRDLFLRLKREQERKRIRIAIINVYRVNDYSPQVFTKYTVHILLLPPAVSITA